VFLLDLDWTGGDRYNTVICSAYLLQLEIYKYLLLTPRWENGMWPELRLKLTLAS